MYIHIEVLVGKCGCYSSDFQDMLCVASRKQCYVFFENFNCFPLIYDYGSIDYGLWRCRYTPIASDCAKFTLEGPHYFLL